MGRLCAKLNSQRGASILIALVFFLLCLTVGTVVLTAATANAGRLANLHEDEQRYLTVSSAARLLREQLEDAEFQMITTETDDASTSIRAGVLAGSLEADAAAVASGRLPAGRALTVELEGLDTVYADYSMDGEYRLTLALYLPGEGGTRHNPMCLTVPAHVSELLREYSEDTGETDENGAPIIVTTIENIKTVAWGTGTITKGAGA